MFFCPKCVLVVQVPLVMCTWADLTWCIYNIYMYVCTCMVHRSLKSHITCRICLSLHVTLLVDLHGRMREAWVRVPPECSFFFWKSCLRSCVVLCCVALLCLSFFLSLFLSVWVIMYLQHTLNLPTHTYIYSILGVRNLPEVGKEVTCYSLHVLSIAIVLQVVLTCTPAHVCRYIHT